MYTERALVGMMRASVQCGMTCAREVMMIDHLMGCSGRVGIFGARW